MSCLSKLALNCLLIILHIVIFLKFISLNSADMDICVHRSLTPFLYTLWNYDRLHLSNIHCVQTSFVGPEPSQQCYERCCIIPTLQKTKSKHK